MKILDVCCILIVLSLFFVLLIKNVESYDYDRENPHALISGYNVAGTVYASDPDNSPGLGWIL